MSGTSFGQLELTAGDTLGRYELLVSIGAGGMGNVWAARLNGSRGFRKLVAIKTIVRPMVSADSEQMLFQEAVLASQIHHQNVAQTFELSEHEGTLYLVMELVPGESLSYLRKAAVEAGGIPLLVSVNIIGQICRGLRAAHDICDESGNRMGLVHRDISAPNIMITPDGTAKIVDFGVATTATASDVTSVKGKLSNLAPEQLRGEAVDARADLFATGILLYSLTVGRHPFRAADDKTTMQRIVSQEEAALPSTLVRHYPKALEAVVLRALKKDRTQRYQTAAEFLDELVHAVPDAFGPNADAFVTSFVQSLMKDRIAERRSALRVAEELAERSSRVSLLPTAVAHPAPVEAMQRRTSKYGVAAIVAGFGVLAISAFSIHVPKPEVPALRSSGASNSHREPSNAVMPAAVITAPLKQGSENLGPPGTGGSVVRSEPQEEPVARRSSTDTDSRDRESRDGTGKDAADSRDKNREVLAAPSREPADASAAADHPEVSAESTLSAKLAVLPTSAATAAVQPAPVAASNAAAQAPSSPVLVSSRIGHRQLRIDPSADGYKPRIPHALVQYGHSWSTRVHICVTSTGSVSKVDILASANPALDVQISKAVARWRYEPLRTNGEAAPFCYTLLYEFAGS